ncbi:MAG: choice-of-anchor D domain-containing protein [Candidatus Thiodiazotropha sp. (ex Codakia rugifera)]|nr:choice-of-anchor D domain-containing protein [Candidatus Thiodiazotropha sp. (ex Codakia rugifera)]
MIKLCVSVKYLLTIALIAGVLSTLGCDDAKKLVIRSGSVDFNDRIRVDLDPLSTEQKNDPQRFFASGMLNDKLTALVSELYPSVLLETELSKLRASEVYWMTGIGGRIAPTLALSYETLLLDIKTINDEKFTYSKSHRSQDGEWKDSKLPATVLSIHKRLGLSNPVTRQILLIDGKIAHIEPAGILNNTSLWIQRCSDSSLVNHPDSPPYGIAAGCTEFKLTPEICGSQPTRIAINHYPPFTVVRCQLNVDTDVSFRLRPELAKATLTSNLNYRQHTVLPHIKIIPVDEGRRLVRPLQFEMMDDDDGANFWYFEVQDNGRRWKENFAPNLFVSQVKIFHRQGELPTDEPRYLNASEIRKLRFGRGSWGCSAVNNNQGHGVIDMQRDCEISDNRAVLLTTPSYQHANPSTALRWSLELRASAPSTDLYLEFMVKERPATAARGLRVAPPVLDMGNVQEGVDSKIGTIQIINEGNTAVTIERLILQGSDHNAFQLGTFSLPHSLAPGEHAGLDLTFMPHRVGRFEGSLVVHGADVAGAKNIQTQLYGYGVDLALDLSPVEANFARPGRAEESYRKYFQLGNVGHIPIELGAIHIVGQDANTFHILSGRCLDTDQINRSNETNDMLSGEFECIEVLYVPSQQGEHRAQLWLETSAGVTSAQLYGHCIGHCTIGASPGPDSPLTPVSEPDGSGRVLVPSTNESLHQMQPM